MATKIIDSYEAPIAGISAGVDQDSVCLTAR